MSLRKIKMRWYKKILFLLLILSCGGVFFGIGKVLAASTSSVNVQITVPGGSGCVGNCNPPTDNPPAISAVSSTVTYNSAVVTWTASDDHSISSVAFVYGVTNSYGQTGAINGTYSVSLSGLASSTIYYYKITVIDNAAQATVYNGSFQTNTGPQIDVTPPVISNISVNPSQTSAVITFITNENSTAQMNYGVTAGLGSNSSEGGSAGINHEITLLGLSPSTTYFFQIIATDVALNSSNSSVLNFKTTKDLVAPPDVSNLSVATGTSYLTLSWTNPSLSFAPDFAGVKVLRKLGVHASVPNDSGATSIYDGTGQSYNDSSVVANNTYYYTVFSYDQSGNYSPGVFVSGKLTKVVSEICDNNIDDNNDGKIDCLDPGCFNDIVCKPPKVEICDNNIDDDANGKVDCADTACALFADCKVKPKVEICDNNIDDDGNGKTDCADTACVNDVNCEIKIPTTTEPGTKPACSDGSDNDGDGKIDYPADPGCTSISDNDEYNPPENTVPDFEKLSLDKVRFFAGSHQIELFANGNNVAGLSGSNLSFHIKISALIAAPSSFILRIGDSEKH
ncbi:MAG: fibronectin type III domain-containing protein, partial [Candidatus Magasanikbacteria bacterium]|nr:fibronectin type III domain-containing protein [Candidatus Magasanikbacteria bacterium]